MRYYEAYYEKVLAYMRYRCSDLHTVEDLTAQTFELALDHLDQYQAERAPFGAWLFGIARNLVTDHLRALQKSGLLPLEYADGRPSSGPTPEEHLIHGELQMALLHAFEVLSERQRDILALKFGARFTNRRIAEISGLSDSNVGVIIYRALHKLRAALDGSGDPTPPEIP